MLGLIFRESVILITKTERGDFWQSAVELNCFNLFDPFSTVFTRSGELRTQKLRSHLLKTQRSEVLPFKFRVNQHMAMHATLTSREFFLANFYPPGRFICIFSKTSLEFFLHQLWLTPAPVSACKINRSASLSLQTIDAGSHVECPRNIHRLQNMRYYVSGLAFRNCECGFYFPRECGAIYTI